MSKPSSWIARQTNAEIVNCFMQALGLSQAAATVLANRGITNEVQARRFLDPNINQLADPSLFADIDKAVERIYQALLAKETIGIFGDYDVDGVTSTTLLWEFLEQIGAPVTAVIPNRLTDGYGLSKNGVDRLRKAGASLVITVDCGITAHEEVSYAVNQNIDIIVIDHHTVPVCLPVAVAVVNPHRPDCKRGGQHLCAVAVTFNVCIALRRFLREKGYFADKPEPNLINLMDLLALGTVADVMPLIEDNRVYVKYGLEVISRGTRPGMRALINLGRTNTSNISAGTLGFQIGPRINAAGRLEDAMPAVTLLRSTNYDEALAIAQTLDELNQERQQLQRDVVEEAIAEIDNSPEHQAAFVLVLHRDHWHPGVVGIAASKIVEKYGKPTVVIGTGGKGSGRSIAAFHLHDALCQVKSSLSGFGGHAHAVGVHIEESQIANFRAQLSAYAKTVLTEDQLRQQILYDDLIKVQDIDLELIEELEKFAPYGRGNPECLFRINHVVLINIRILKEAHISGQIVAGTRKIRVIGFGLVERNLDWNQPVDLLAVPEINEFNGQKTIQLRIKDARSS